MLNDLTVGRVISKDEIIVRVIVTMAIAFTVILTCSWASSLASNFFLW